LQEWMEIVTMRRRKKGKIHMKCKKRVVAALPAVVIMIIIFLFSAQHAEQSSESSDYIAEKLCEIREVIIETCTTKEAEPVSKEHMKDLTFIIRKLAHTMEYAVLGISLCYFFYQMIQKRWHLFLFTLVTGFLYACSDEWHQSFVPGRSCEFRDVLIDTNGVFLGIIIFYLIVKLYREW